MTQGRPSLSSSRGRSDLVGSNQVLWGHPGNGGMTGLGPGVSHAERPTSSEEKSPLGSPGKTLCLHTRWKIGRAPDVGGEGRRHGAWSPQRSCQGLCRTEGESFHCPPPHLPAGLDSSLA